MNPIPTSSMNTVEDSLLNAHQAAGRAFSLLDAIWSDLTGEGDSSAPDAPYMSGVIYSADNLSTKVSIFADRLESIRAKIANPKVVGISQAQNNLANTFMTKGYGG